MWIDIDTNYKIYPTIEQKKLMNQWGIPDSILNGWRPFCDLYIWGKKSHEIHIKANNKRLYYALRIYIHAIESNNVQYQIAAKQAIEHLKTANKSKYWIKTIRNSDDFLKIELQEIIKRIIHS
jgi:hypothetical protein